MTPPTLNLWKSGGQLDPGPLRDAIRLDLSRRLADTEDDNQRSGLALLARDLGLFERQLYRIVRGESRTVGLDLADVYCCKTGRHLADLYPSLYEPEQVEADVAESERLACPKRARRRQLHTKARRALHAKKTPEERAAESARKTATARRNRAALSAEVAA